ncbi:MAG: HD domain-containing phosphohydrolase [Dehalococcoidia bacterium]
MRRLRLDLPVSPGAKLARDVTGPAGEIIARAGHPLSDRTVRALRGRGVSWCYVDDAWGEHLELVPLDAGRGTVRPLLREIEQRIGDIVAPLVSLSTQRALEALRKSHPTAPLARGRCAEDMPGAVRAFLEACTDARPAGGWLIDREAAEDEDGHAIGVAAVTAQITLALGMDAAERAATVTAALLHDVGMVFVPRAVRMTPPGDRSIPERIRYEDHAVLGEALLEPLCAPSLHLAIVAGEHHEAADGGGYPRRRVGGHRVLRTAEEKRDLGRIALASEIVAVADAYERVVSPSAGWEGRSPATARAILEGAAGRTLNREIVHRFLASFPVLPLGTEVRITRGPHAGLRGLVCELPPGHEEQPVVRLFLDRAGRPLAEPIEVVLAREPDTAIEIADAA